MILTLTLNPAVDKTILVPSIALGEVQRVQESHLDPGGKGINVSRVVDRLGWPTIAFGVLAGEIGQLISRALETEGVQHHFLQVPGQTRLNVTIFDQTTAQGTSFWDRGPVVGTESLIILEEEIRPWFYVCPVLVLAGSLPPGVPADIYAKYTEAARAAGIKTILDTDGEPLRQGVAAHPFLIKPNVAEAERLVGRELPTLSAIVDAARALHADGIEVVIISMGAQGAICVEDGHIWRVIAPTIVRRSTVGSGDSLVAGLAVAIARGESLIDGLKLGTAAGAATAMAPGTSLASRADVGALLPRVHLEQIEGSAPAAKRTAR